MIETSNRRDARPRSRTGWTRQRLDARPEAPPPPRFGFDRARWGRLGATLGLVGLTAVTSWVVASISVWLVPVYVGAMVLIFAAPRKNPTKPADETEAGESSSVEDPIAAEPIEMKTDAVDEPATEPPAPEASAEAPPKPRKRRVRARKSAKKGADAAEIAAESGRVTWVRVGPGKFVRSVAPVVEFVGPPAPETEPEVAQEPEPAPIADDPTPAPELGSDEEAGQDSWMNSEDPAPSVEYDHGSEIASPDASEIAVEEYDDAPSDFGESLQAAASDLEADHDEVEPAHPPQADTDNPRDFYPWPPPAQF